MHRDITVLDTARLPNGRLPQPLAFLSIDLAPLSEAELDGGFACFGTGGFQIDYRFFFAKTKPESEGR